MTDVIHYEPGAATVGECFACGGPLLFVDDLGEPRPIEAQCGSCGVLTGVARDWKPRPASWVEPGSPEAIGF